MAVQNNETTQIKILKTAARMFSDKGYDKVTMREIAKEVGINSASIYYHFSSKNDILLNLFEFYSEELRKVEPDVKNLLKLAETEAPHDVLMKTEFHYDEKIRGLLSQILVTATLTSCFDEGSKKFIQESVFAPINTILKPLLERLVELKKIKPLDIDAFIKLIFCYCFGAVALSNSPLSLSVDEYQAIFSYIYSFIAPIEQ